MPWPETDDFPAHSITATRALFDHTLAKNAANAGAHLWEQTKAVAPIWSTPAEDKVRGVIYERADGTHGSIKARTVVLADGGSSRLAVQMGLHRDEKRPMGAAVRAYYKTPRSTMDHMEGFLEMRNPEGELLPGYGWIFPLDDGLANVGWGLISTSEHFQSTSYRKVLDDWVASFPEEWDMTPDTRVGRVKGAGLPMGHNRHPHLYKGAVLVGDSGGMVNPFNGEGISYAIEAADMAARAIDDAFRYNDESALLRLPTGAEGDVGRLLPARPDLPDRHGQPRRSCACAPSTACPGAASWTSCSGRWPPGQREEPPTSPTSSSTPSAEWFQPPDRAVSLRRRTLCRRHRRCRRVRAGVPVWSRPRRSP